MNNNNEISMTLKVLAEKASQEEWEVEGENIWYSDGGYTKHLMYIYQGDDVSEEQNSANTRYVAAANPATILSLLAERDADKALIAELKHDVDAANARVDAGCAQLCKQDDLIVTLRDACSQWERKAISNFEECAEMSARIEELESQRKLAFTASNRWADKFRDAEKRITELESALNLASASYAGERERADALQARTVKLPESFTKSMYGTPLYEHVDILAMLAAAGITLDVGE